MNAALIARIDQALADYRSLSLIDAGSVMDALLDIRLLARGASLTEPHDRIDDRRYVDCMVADDLANIRS